MPAGAIPVRVLTPPIGLLVAILWKRLSVRSAAPLTLRAVARLLALEGKPRTRSGEPQAAAAD
jgi:hypothetical protein